MSKIDNYPGNDRKAKASSQPASEPEKPREPLDPIVEGGARKRKKPLGKRFVETFTAEETSNVGSYLFFDVFVPGVKNIVFDLVRDGFERVLWGESSHRSSRRRSASGYTSYNTMYRERERDRNPDYRNETRDISKRGRATHDFGEILIENRGEAEEVIDRLIDLVDKFGLATVSDLYELVGMTPNYTDQKWGWTDLRVASVQPVRGGYLLDLPRPEPVQ